MFYRKDNNGNGIFSKISYKRKIIIFIILSIIAIGIIVYEGSKRKAAESIKNTKNEKQILELNSNETKGKAY